MRVRLLVYFFICLSALNLSTARAASIWLDPAVVTASPGDTISFYLTVDFSSDPTLGGGIDIFYDSSLLSYHSFDFGSATVVIDPAFSRLPNVMTNKLEGLAFGDFSGISAGAIGTLTFQALVTGNTTLGLADTTDTLVGGFYSAGSYGQQFPVYTGSSVRISSVPVPGAFWLFGSGMIGLLAMGWARHGLA